ncbi:uncharacterized protein LOC142108933 [Mixophyes fleayi]|uniref:uncharacterized protein LOC142108933 n=1 Tax=Mixophyes fleayi TaxID=3061075 RepID=UPI003F4E28B5
MSRDRRGEQAEEREMEVEGSEEGEGEVEETGQGRKTKTGRNVRFSHDENCVLVHNIIPCYEVILGNLAARTPLRRRHQLWGRVCEAVNAVGPLKRTVAHCRKRFSDIKRRLKEKMAQERRSTRRTGGGPPLRMEYTTYEEELRQIMPAEIVEGINVQDTDSPSFGQVVDSPGPQFSPSARPTPPPSARDSGTDEQAGPSSYQPPQAESLEMSPEPEDQTTITLVTVDAPVSGLQEVSPGPAEPSHHQPAPESMDPAREMALSIGAFQQQQTLFMDRQTGHMSQIAAQLRRIHRSTSQIPAAINRLLQLPTGNRGVKARHKHHLNPGGWGPPLDRRKEMDLPFFRKLEPGLYVFKHQIQVTIILGPKLLIVVQDETAHTSHESFGVLKGPTPKVTVVDGLEREVSGARVYLDWGDGKELRDVAVMDDLRTDVILGNDGIVTTFLNSVVWQLGSR